MSLKAVQCLRCSLLFSCRTSRQFAGKQSWRVGGRGLGGLRSLSVSARWCGEDKVTHTGQVRDSKITVKQVAMLLFSVQKWESDDYRNVRFIDREKQVRAQYYTAQHSTTQQGTTPGGECSE